MDILFKNDNFVFSYRVGGILTHNGKILLQRKDMPSGLDRNYMPICSPLRKQKKER